MPFRLYAVLALLLAMLAAVVPSSSTAAESDGPPLTVTRAEVLSALTCAGDPTTGPPPVLFLHGTTSSSRANWSWNWNRALTARSWAYCDLGTPDSANADIQVAGEYVVGAIRILHARAGRDISLVGHSQGGMVGRWALKYWPDTRDLVDDYVGLSSSNHGTRAFDATCTTTRHCTAANWQQRSGSDFLGALNEGPEAWPSVDYTEIATAYDELVLPYTSTFLAGEPDHVTNVTVQQVCPTTVVEHFGMAYDNAAWLIGLDALANDGPAKPARIDRSTCGRPFMPGVNPLTFATDAAAAMAQTAQSTLSSPSYAAEPPLADYAR